MNILKAADDIKNLSDQQLLSASQNPVMLPPYLVLAEMKRREQMRAEFAKSQQQQQPPTVIQQTAQNLAQSQQQQGQPQQGMSQQGMLQPPQPQAQGIMQGAPQQVMAMASGGYVPRYAAGTPKPDPMARLMSFAAEARNPSPGASQQDRQYQAPAGLSVDPRKIMSEFQQKPIRDYLGSLDELQGKRDYSAEQRLVDYQTQMAEKNKPRLGDALIAAGAAMASNRDNRVGLANILAQSIGVGSQTYEAARKNQDEARKAAMAGQVSLGRMKQDDFQKRVATALQMAQGDQTKLIKAYEISQDNQRALEVNRNKFTSDQEDRQLKIEIARNNLNLDVLKTAIGLTEKREGFANALNVARIGAAGSASNRPSNLTATNAGFLLKSNLEEQEKIYGRLDSMDKNSPQYSSAIERLNEIKDNNRSLNLILQDPNTMSPGGINSGGSKIRVVTPSYGAGTK
jgi:hypothetical protein